jgi:dTDP-4-dehydrorhamnose 3,5-epimerase
MNAENYTITLEKHPTKDVEKQHVNGSLTLLWRDYDHILKTEPKMAYVSIVNQGERKGPHLHKKRNSYFYCIDGSVIFVLRDNSGNFIEIESNPENRKMVFVPSGMASAHLNISEKPSQVLALADIAWKPNDNEMINVKFDEYDWKKWTKQ